MWHAEGKAEVERADYRRSREEQVSDPFSVSAVLLQRILP